MKDTSVAIDWDDMQKIVEVMNFEKMSKKEVVHNALLLYYDVWRPIL